MQNLRDQLLKAKIIDRKSKKLADQEARTTRKKKGYSAVVAEEAARQAAFDEKRDKLSKSARKREKKRQQALRAGEARHRMRQLVLDGVVPDNRGGPRRFYFVTRQGRIPYMQVADDLGRTLEAGGAAIVEVPLESSERFVIVTRDTVQRMGDDGTDFIRFWNH